MVTTILSTDELSVLGGPSRIDLLVDLGPQGQRGSQIFAGLGDPNDPATELGFTPETLDLYINILTSSEEYLFVYQYQNIAGSFLWVKLLKLFPNTLSKNGTYSFSSGEAQISIPVIDIAPLENLGNITSESFNIQHSIVNNSNPISSTLSIQELETSGGELILPLTIKAIEFNEDSWIPLDGQNSVHLFITVV